MHQPRESCYSRLSDLPSKFSAEEALISEFRCESTSSTNKIDIMVSTSRECGLNHATNKRVWNCSGVINQTV